MNTKTFFVDADDEGTRLDVYLSDCLEDVSRSYIQKLIKESKAKVCGEVQKANYKLRGTEEITIDIPDPEPLNIIAEDIPFDILWEDDDLIFINKPKGVVVHPAPGHYTGTIVNGLINYLGDSLSGINGVLRPGIVHRIDMDTSGVIVICKNDFAHRSVAEQLADHSITRKYYAICNGLIEGEGTVDAPIERNKNNRLKMSVASSGGKRAVTHYKALETFDKYTYIECQLETGRTHQIRVHLNHIHHPLMGDEVYGNMPCKFKTQGQVLHAGVLGLKHPRTGEYIEVSAPLPDYFLNILNILKR